MLSVIIVNYRTWDHISNGLETLLPSVPAGSPLEIIVVDNHSQDGRLAEFAVRQPQVKVVQSQGNFGYAHGCNLGAKTARGSWLLFMNPDVVAEWKNIKALWDAVQNNPDYAILTAPQFSLKGRLQKSFGSFVSKETASPLRRAIYRKLYPQRYPDPRTPLRRIDGIVNVDWVSGSLLMISKSKLEAVGGWDEDFWLYYEDADLCRRVHLQGGKIGYFPGAQFIHAHASSTRRSLATTALAKSEAIISKNLYLLKHMANAEGELIRAKYRKSSTRVYRACRVLNCLCLGRLRKIDLMLRIHSRLRLYYRRVDETGDTLSELSINYRNK